jgi:hypothetical protein
VSRYFGSNDRISFRACSKLKTLQHEQYLLPLFINHHYFKQASTLQLKTPNMLFSLPIPRMGGQRKIRKSSSNTGMVSPPAVICFFFNDSVVDDP